MNKLEDDSVGQWEKDNDLKDAEKGTKWNPISHGMPSSCLCWPSLAVGIGHSATVAWPALTASLLWEVRSPLPPRGPPLLRSQRKGHQCYSGYDLKICSQEFILQQEMEVTSW